MTSVHRKIALFFALALILVPFGAFATSHILPIDSGTGLVSQCEGALCRACDLVELSNNVITFAIGFAVIVATLMFAYAGILYVTAANAGQEQIKKAHKIFVNIFVGLLIVLLAWLLVNIMFSVLTGKGLDVWSKIECHANPTTAPFASQSDRNVGGSNVVTGGTGTGTNPGGGVRAGEAQSRGTYTHAQAVSALQRAGVCGGSVPCFAPQSDGASLAGVRVQTIEQIIELHKGCECQFTVTSAVRPSGAHATGYKVDVRINAALDRYIETTPSIFAVQNGGRRISWGGQMAVIYKDSCGTVYAREYGSQPHWDIEAIRGSLCLY